MENCILTYEVTYWADMCKQGESRDGFQTFAEALRFAKQKLEENPGVTLRAKEVFTDCDVETSTPVINWNLGKTTITTGGIGYIPSDVTIGELTA